MQKAPRILLMPVALVLVLASQGATAADLPQYQFEPGLELVYAGSSEFNFGDGAFRDSDTTRFWVTGQNKDGSWHLISIGKSQDIRTGNFASTNDSTTYGHLDLMPDGRRVDKPAKFSEQQNYPAFFPLPEDTNQMNAGWQFAESEAVQKDFRVKETGKTCRIEYTEQGIFSDIYEMASSGTVYFNNSDGRVEKIETKSAQGYGFTGHGTGTIELKSTTVRDKDWMAQLAADADAVDKAQAAVEEAVESIKNGAAKADAAGTTATQALESAVSRVKDPSLQDIVKKDLARLDEQMHYAQQENDRNDSVVNKPAATWTTTDLNGQKHSLEDYRGKVVALDFWYRGCGWCMRAMPQIKALNEQFRGQPVVILGMNTDQKDKDAQFVIDKLQLNYATLHGTGIPEKYGVQGFPTFIVIDQKGVVRARHVGYSPLLQEEMAKTISGLLAEGK